MNDKKFRQQMNELPDQVSERFHRAVNDTLAEIEAQEQGEQLQRRPYNHGVRRVAAFALAAVLMFGTVAFAATQWGIFDTLGFMLGGQPVNEEAAMQKILHQETVNGVEITIHEAAYDGRTLFIQYSHRILDETEPFGVLDEKGNLKEGIRVESLQKLHDKNVGWWIDHFWINGQCVDMPNNSGAVETGTLNPGEIFRTEYWRLDNLDMELSGKVEIAMPLGECQPLSDYYPGKDHPDKFDADGNMLKPDKGLVTFTFDVGDVLSKVTTLHPNIETVTPDVTAKVSEAAFTPLMTYITLDLKGNPEALTAYKAEHGEGHRDKEGKLLWPYSALDVHNDYICSLTLVDGEGKMLFPDEYGNNGIGDSWAEFLYPYIAPENMPEELWLAPVAGDGVDMEYAIRVK